MKIAFSKLEWWNPLDIVIGIVSKGKMVHVELVIEDGDICYSSRPFGGTDFKKINLTPKEWVVLSLPTIDYSKTVDFCLTELDCGYDWSGVCAFVFNTMKPSKTRWFCSEFVVAALQKSGLCKGLDAHLTTPQALYDWVTEHC